ncbi:MAG: helix-turn-helix domain-containing protein [Thermoanaerobaculia bacterium]
MKTKTRKRDEDIEGAPSEEVLSLMDLLQTLARVMGLKNAALARRAEVSLASLNRYFKGQAQPRLDFVLKIVRAMGFEAGEFFEMAYPKTAAPSAARQKLNTMFKPVRPGKAVESPRTPEPEDTPLQREEVERMLKEFRSSLMRDLRDVLERK